MASKQIIEYDEATVITGDDAFIIQLDSDGTFRHVLYSTMQPDSITGQIISVDPDKSVPSDDWFLCSGAVCTTTGADAAYLNKRVPNMNGADVVLTLTWTADSGGAYASVTETDIAALGIGDEVTGSGITTVDGQPPQVIDITGSGPYSVIISDTAANGEIESTFTNDGRYPGGGLVAGTKRDQFQGHVHKLRGSGTLSAGSPYVGGMRNTNDGPSDAMSYYGADSLDSDGANGPTRTGTRTRPMTQNVKYYIKVK